YDSSQRSTEEEEEYIFKKTHSHNFNCFVGALSRVGIYPSLTMELTAGQWSAWKLWNAPGTLSRPQPGLSCRANESQSADPSYRNVD
ncbi:hypothetical protein QWA68_001133, partial [Fusarium oxysporum]